MWRWVLNKVAGRGKTGGSTQDGFFLHVRCDACGERFSLFIDKSHDLTQQFNKDGSVTYKLIKEVVGAGCRNKIQVVIDFDTRKNEVQRQIENGTFLEDTQQMPDT